MQSLHFQYNITNYVDDCLALMKAAAVGSAHWKQKEDVFFHVIILKISIN